MTLENTLAKVDADLAAGRIPMARQRLRGLVSSYPTDLSLRVKLAGIYRLFGDPVQAGRWSYLDDGRSAEETAAFEARFRGPVDRMQALAWRGPESAAETLFAREQLASVRLAASQLLGESVDWDQTALPADEPAESRSLLDVVFGLGCIVGAVVVLALMGIAVATVIDWL